MLEKREAERAKKLEDEKQNAGSQEATETNPSDPDGDSDSTGTDVQPDETSEKETNQSSETRPHGEDGVYRKLASALSQPGDAIDEALLKDDLTESELKGLMNSKPYMRPSDPRHKQVQSRVKQWFGDHWGVEPAKVDAAGRIIPSDKPNIPFPVKPEKPSEPGTNRPLDESVRKVAERIADRARRTTPFEAVKTLQSALNNQDDFQARPLPPLKEDGIAGPMTSRALRFTTKRLGADRLLGGLFG